MTKGPLHGVRVLDLGNFLAGPFCATVLAEFGAEVIKVEQPGVGDPLRRFGTMTEAGDTMIWLSEARNKKFVTLDLRTPRGREICLDLVARSDIVVENFRPGVLERWNLGYDQLNAVTPRVVMVRISGYGQTGPYRLRPGFARIAHAFSGLVHLAGEPGRTPVIPGSTSLADYMAGVWGALGAMMALRERDTNGRGQYIDIGLYEAMFRFLDEIAPAYDANGFIREPQGADTINVVPHSHYPTSDERWIAIACTSDKIFARFAEVMGRPELAGDGIWGTVAQREADREAVDALVGAWTGRHTREQILALCSAGEVPCGPLLSIDEIFEDPQYRARDNIAFITEARVPGKNQFAVPNVMPRLSGTPGRIDWLGPPLGSHTEDVLKDWAGLGPDEIAALRTAGAI